MVTLAVSDSKQVPIAQTSDSGSSAGSHSERPAHGSYENHPFNDDTIAQHWRKVYESAKYEGRHCFDPHYKWTAAEEKRIVRKVGLRICARIP
jgi:hypothetical protein